MEMRIVVPDAASAGALAERLTLVVGAERISLLRDLQEVDVRVEHDSIEPSCTSLTRSSGGSITPRSDLPRCGSGTTRTGSPGGFQSRPGNESIDVPCHPPRWCSGVGSTRRTIELAAPRRRGRFVAGLAFVLLTIAAAVLVGRRLTHASWPLDHAEPRWLLLPLSPTSPATCFALAVGTGSSRRTSVPTRPAVLPRSVRPRRAGRCFLSVSTTSSRWACCGSSAAFASASRQSSSRSSRSG